MVGGIGTLIGALVLGYRRIMPVIQEARDEAKLARAKAASGEARLIILDDKVYELGQAVDGRLTKLLVLAEANAEIREAAALARGRLEGQAEERAMPMSPTNGEPAT